MKFILLFVFAITISLSSFAQIKNGGFESWDTTYAASYQDVLNDSLQIPNAVTGEIEFWSYKTNNGIARTTDAYEGNYAVIVHNWYSYVKEYLYYRDSISSRPKYLIGYYKFIGQEINGLWPYGTGTVVLVDNLGDTVANTVHHFDTISSFVPFQIEIDYLNNKVVDSVFITFQNSKLSCWNNMVCNLLYLDKLAFSESSTVGIELEEKNVIRMYPNPTDGLMQIVGGNENQSIEVYNSIGSLILRSEFAEQLDLTNLNTGFYIIKVLDQGGKVLHSEKLIKN